MERHGASRLAVILIVGAVGLSLIGVVAGEAAAQIAKPAEEEMGGDYDP